MNPKVEHLVSNSVGFTTRPRLSNISILNFSRFSIPREAEISVVRGGPSIRPDQIQKCVEIWYMTYYLCL